MLIGMDKVNSLLYGGRFPNASSGGNNERAKNSSRSWLVAYTKMHHERKVRDDLERMGIDSFVASRIEMRKWSDRIKKREVILLPMYLFVHVSPEERSMVLEHPSVLRYMSLRSEHRPAVVPDDQIEHFRFMLDHSEEVVRIIPGEMAQGQKVRVLKGPLEGLEGEFVTFEGKHRIILRIESLGAASVAMPPGYVEAIKEI